MKEKYLEELEILLSQYDISKEEKDDILADYGEMIDDAISKNLSDKKIIEMIGSPKTVVKDLKEGFKEKEEDGYYYHDGVVTVKGRGRHGKHRDNRVVALMPFISVITFFVLGFWLQAWHPGWMVFLSIPVVAILINVFERGKSEGLVALSPFIAVVTYLILGFVAELWHPSWLIFLIIPVFGIISGKKKMSFIPFLTALSPFIAITTFILVGTYVGYWHIAWLVFLLIPMIGILNNKVVWKRWVLELSFVLAIAAYLYLGLQFDEWLYSLFAFLIPAGVSLLLSEAEFKITINQNKPVWILSLLCTLVYIGFGLWFSSTWAYLWMIFLTIPVFTILKYSDEKNKLVAVMPFISVVIFFSLGHFFGYWAFSWLAFLLIPMVAIIRNA